MTSLQPQDFEQPKSLEKAPMLPPTEGVPGYQPPAEDIRAARLDELRAMEASGQVVARKSDAQQIGVRAVQRARDAQQTGIPVEVREPSAPDTPVFH